MLLADLGILSHSSTTDEPSPNARLNPIHYFLGSMLTMTVCGTVSVAWADTNLAQINTPLHEISVSSTRTENRADALPAALSIITSRQIEETLANDVKELFRFEPGVAVRRSPNRFQAAGAATGRAGNEGINIRGLEGNQVLILQDGIRLPNAFSFGAQATGRLDYVDVEAFKRVELLRGPASPMYGSDGLGGALNFITKDPADYLRIFKKDTYIAIKPGYNSIDRSFGVTTIAAMGNTAYEAMLLTTLRKGHEPDNMGSRANADFTRDQANPADASSSYILAKWVAKSNLNHIFKFTAEQLERKIDTHVLSAIRYPTGSNLTNTLTVPPLAAASVLDLNARDRIRRQRFSLDYLYDGQATPLFDRLQATVYYQDSSNQQISNEDRNISADRIRDNLYKQNLLGLSSQFVKEWGNQASALHRLSYGLDTSRSVIDSLRNGTVAPFGETFPTKAFPKTDYTLLGLYLQDEIRLGAWSVIPGLRYDEYSLKPQTDPLYVLPSASSNDQALSPKLAAMFDINPALKVYGQYAQGFRAPTPEQVNNGFTNVASGYTSIGNPNLKPETSRGLEVGLKGQAGNNSYTLAIYSARYKDFIAQQVIGGTGQTSDPLIYQNINFNDVRIHGLEARLTTQITQAWQGQAGLAYAKGSSHEKTGNYPLNSIEPLKAVLGLRYESRTESNHPWMLETLLTHYMAKKSADIDERNASGGSYFASPASTLVDIFGQYEFNRHISINLGLYNLLNKKVWYWSDVRGLAANSVFKDAYTAAGRNVSIAMKFQY